MKESILFPGFFTRDDASDKEDKARTDIPESAIRVPLIGVGDDLRDLSSFKEMLSHILTKQRIVFFCTRILELFSKRALCFLNTSGAPMSKGEVEDKVSFRLDAKLGGISKERLLRLLLPVVYDTKAFLAFLDTYGKNTSEKWLDLLNRYMLPESSFDKLCVKGLFNKGYFYAQSIVQEKDSPVNLLEGAKEEYGQTYVKVPAVLTRHQLKALYPEILSGKPVAELPQGANLFSGDDIQALIAPLTLICQTDQIKLTQKGSITQACLKRIAPTIEMKPMLPPTESMYKDTTWRHALLMMSLYHIVVRRQMIGTEGEVLRFLVENLHEICESCEMQILPHLKSYNCYDYRVPFKDRVHKVLKKRFKKIEAGKWYSVKELELNLRISEVDYELGMGILLYGGNYTVNGQYAEESDFYHNVTLPYLKGHLAMLAAYGIVDIATEPEGEHTMDGDFYYRITPIGEYALGMTDKLVALDGDDSPYFAVDSEHRIIRNLRHANPMLSFLKEMAVETAENVYEITPESFMRPCSDKADMKSRIKRFSTHILGEHAGEWKDFFKSLDARVERVRLSTQNFFYLLDIDPTATKVLEFIDTDPQIRANTLKVEGYRLLIAPEFYNTLLNRLRDIGYIPATGREDNDFRWR